MIQVPLTKTCYLLLTDQEYLAGIRRAKSHRRRREREQRRILETQAEELRMEQREAIANKSPVRSVSVEIHLGCHAGIGEFASRLNGGRLTPFSRGWIGKIDPRPSS